MLGWMHAGKVGPGAACMRVPCEQRQFFGWLIPIVPTFRLQTTGAQQPCVGTGVQHLGHTLSGWRLPPRLGTIALSGAGGGDHELQFGRRCDKFAIVKEDARAGTIKG